MDRSNVAQRRNYCEQPANDDDVKKIWLNQQV